MARVADARPHLVSALLMPVEAVTAPRIMAGAGVNDTRQVVALILRDPRADAGHGSPPTDATPAPIWLTRREREVLALLCLRLTDAEIAAQFFLSTRTINSHVAHIPAKLGAANRREAAAVAMRQELV
jgi:DNA-binding CsgD family transcriptional regulator